jgi:hypothetical protein
MSDIKTDDIDAAAVMVQEGTHDKPGMILGAAVHDGRTANDGKRTADDRAQSR